MICLTSTSKPNEALLAQEVEGVELPISYLRRSLQGAEMDYPPIERRCLALIFVTQNLHHYFLAHPLNLVIKSNPFKVSSIQNSLSGTDRSMASPTQQIRHHSRQPNKIQEALLDLLA